MSGCNGADSQCETVRERNDTAMGDVLAKERNDDLGDEKTGSTSEPEIQDQRQEADGAADAVDDNPSPSNCIASDPIRNTIISKSMDAAITELKEDQEIDDLSSIRVNTTPNDFCRTSVSPIGVPRHARGPCSCDTCKVKREMFMEELEEVMRLQGLWMELRQHIRTVFNAAVQTPRISESLNLQCETSRLREMHDTVVQLCKRDPHQLFMRLVGQAQEFVVEVKVRLLALLHDRSANNLAEIFLTGLLDGYDALISTSSQISELIEPLEKEHLYKFNLTWQCCNKKLYQNYVYTDPLVQNNLPPFIGQLRKLLPLKGPEYQGLVHRYLAFDDEMTRIGDLWPETERLIDKYNGEQTARMTRLRKFREGWELFTARRKLIQQRMWNKSTDCTSQLQEIDGQLLALAARDALSPDDTLASPNSEFALDTPSMSPSNEIVQSLLEDLNKSPYQRLADIVGAMAAAESQLEPNGDGIGSPISVTPAFFNDPEFRFGYEWGASLVLKNTALRPISPIHEERGDCEGSEGAKDNCDGEEQRCECHVCTVPLTLPTRIDKGPSLAINSPATNLNSLPLNSNGLTGGGTSNCMVANGVLDMNGVYPHLYNLYSAFRSMPNKPIPEQSTAALINNVDEKKFCPIRPLVKKKVEEVELRKKSSEEVEKVALEDTDLRKIESLSCPCLYQHAKEIAERKKEVLESPPCPCLLKLKKKLDVCPCLKKTRTEPVVNGHAESPSPPLPIIKTNPETKKLGSKNSGTSPAQTQMKHSTTQTPNTTHNHNHITHQGPTHAHSHGLLPDLVKSTTLAHRGHSHSNHTTHACHKQANVEHIKRVSCNDLATGDGDCSDSGSSLEDSCSTSSSTPRDSSQHCDCCYCEVFGHGVPSVAPVSRNYNEMRERLRLLLTKKKAKKCKATCSPPKSPVESLTSIPNQSDDKAVLNHPAPRSNTPVSTSSVVPNQDLRDQRDLEALLEFIEGNQNGKRDNNKKAEKKARQKQKKLEEKLKKDEQEAERQKLIEIQKKTPEVTITVVDPQKPVNQRVLPQRTLPEVSILPASAPIVLTTLKNCSTNKKKDKQEIISNAKTKSVQLTTNQKNKTVVGIDMVDGIVSSSHKNRVITDNVDASKLSKNQMNSNVLSAKSNSSSNTIPLKTVELDDKKLSKKERQKLKKEAKKREEAKAKELEKPSETENQPQIVTIKRVMESNGAEPTVTITLKGQTPADDKVLFTLVNGQTKEPSLSKVEQQNQNSSGKKKKTKGNGIQLQQSNKSNSLQQQSNNLKQQQVNTNSGKNSKQQLNNEKFKNNGKVTGEKKPQQQLQQSTNDAKATKSKKDKKNTENKENVSQQQNTSNKSKNQQQNVNGKKQNKVNTPQSPTLQKTQPNSSINNESGGKKSKSQQPLKNSQGNSNKINKDNNNGNINKIKSDSHKNQTKMTHDSDKTIKQRTPIETQKSGADRLTSPLSSQFKDIGVNSKINIENLKLPPGITITKVDAPAKPLPIRSAPMPKPANPPKQTTIIAAPMSDVQSNYAGPQSGGNVIVVDTGKLKHDLLPKSNEKQLSKDKTQNQCQSQSINKKKKKKKGKNAQNVNGTTNVSITPANLSNNSLPSDSHNDEPARILHNPGSNMVTIRNPAFGPPKMEPTQQAAIIKVSENGMVTIRSPALQQAINAGLTPPPKPDFIVKGDLQSSSSKTTTSQNSNAKHQNSIIPSSLAELRSRLTPDCTGLTGLANIQISKVTNGQPIPENGINLKGTSVTLTKVRSETVMDEVQQAKTAVREAISATMAASSIGKGKKKKKKGNGTRQSGDDWNLVESVFTPKDIDLEDGEMDDAERELEAFKRFCLQSVPPARKEKVNLNIKDIVLKKKSSSTATTAAVIAAN